MSVLCKKDGESSMSSAVKDSTVKGSSTENLNGFLNGSQVKAEKSAAIPLEKLFSDFFTVNEPKVVAEPEPNVSTETSINFKPQLKFSNNTSTPKLPPQAPINYSADSEIMDALSNLSSESMYKIVQSVLKAQNCLNCESAELCTNEFEQHKKVQEAQRICAKEIKEALLKDESLHKKFKTAQNIAATVAVAATAAALLGFTIPFAVIASATVSAVTAGASSYYNYRSNQSRVKHIETEHLSQSSNQQLSQATQALQDIVAYNQCEKIISAILGDLLRLHRAIMSKN